MGLGAGLARPGHGGAAEAGQGPGELLFAAVMDKYIRVCIVYIYIYIHTYIHTYSMI